ncbi:hypothetical protein BDQ17DRAFT_1547058 [Cyathus striatus]|nr:hypothetical protein BDQ17DRAFT_1547058 [Cyathus striatus]
MIRETMTEREESKTGPEPRVDGKLKAELAIPDQSLQSLCPTSLPSPRCSPLPLHKMSQASNRQLPMPNYLTEYSKAIANEVKMLLADVGKLREERQKFAMEVAQLLNLKAQYSDGVPQDWLPKSPGPPAVESPSAVEALPAPPAIEEAPVQARSIWRFVLKREKRLNKTTAPPAAMPTSVPVPMPAPPRPGVRAWAQWTSNSPPAPTPVIALVVAPQSPTLRSGLSFGTPLLFFLPPHAELPISPPSPPYRWTAPHAKVPHNSDIAQ